MNDNHAEAYGGKLEWSAPKIDISQVAGAEVGTVDGSDATFVGS